MERCDDIISEICAVVYDKRAKLRKALKTCKGCISQPIAESDIKGGQRCDLGQLQHSNICNVNAAPETQGPVRLQSACADPVSDVARHMHYI